MKRILLFIFFLTLNLKMNPQIHIYVEGDCGYYNSAVFCDVLCKCMGKKAISRWLEDGIHFGGFYCELDSMGCVKKITHVPLPAQKILSKRKIKKIERYLVRHRVSFKFCWYFPEMGIDGYTRYLRENFQKNGTITHPTGGFPYFFMWRYKKEDCLTPYEHLVKEISKYTQCQE